MRTVVIAYPDAPYQEMLAFVARCDKLGMQTNVVPRFASVVNYQTRFEYLGTVPLLNLRAINPESWPFTVKYAVDRVAAGLLLVALAPLLRAPRARGPPVLARARLLPPAACRARRPRLQPPEVPHDAAVRRRGGRR